MVTFKNVNGTWGVLVSGVDAAAAQDGVREFRAVRRDGTEVPVVLAARIDRGMRRGEPWEVWSVEETKPVGRGGGWRARRDGDAPPPRETLSSFEVLRRAAAEAALAEPAAPVATAQTFDDLLAMPVAREVAERIAAGTEGVSW